MISICPPNICTGCGACLNVCAHKAISMREDQLGHLNPLIDVSKCTNCGLCQNICPSVHKQDLLYPHECYATILSPEYDIARCASGGAATAFTMHIINCGGVVYGCSGEDVFNVRHIRIDRLEDVDKLRGSKYVQSNTGNSYTQVKEDLKTGKLVLYTGTPCQIAGLKAFLQKNYSNLFTIDLVCHGVPSQKMLTENIHYYTDETDGKKIKLSFRKKLLSQNDSKAESNSGSKIEPKNGAKTKFKIEYGWYMESETRRFEKNYYNDSYMFSFLQCLSLRESCYTCRYATSARCSDITVFDFWGLSNDVIFRDGNKVILRNGNDFAENVISQSDNNIAEDVISQSDNITKDVILQSDNIIDKGKGISGCLINTEKGAKLFDEAKSLMYVSERDVVEAIIGNGRLQRPSSRHKKHKQFRKDYPKLGLKKAIAKCLKRDRLKLLYIKPITQLLMRILK